MTTDDRTTIQSSKLKLMRFRDRRGWKQFHGAKNLAEAISIESAELLELFLWKDREAIDYELKSEKTLRENIERELADILCFA